MKLHALAGLESRFLGRGREALAQLLDQFVPDRCRLAAERDHPSHAAGRTNGIPVVQLSIEAYEEVAGKQRLLGLAVLLRPVALEMLPPQGLFGAGFTSAGRLNINT